MRILATILFSCYFHFFFSQLPAKDDSLKTGDKNFFLGLNFIKTVYRLQDQSQTQGSITGYSNYFDNFAKYPHKDNFFKSYGIGLDAILVRKRFKFMAELQFSQTAVTFKGTSGTGNTTYKTGAQLYDTYEFDYASKRTDCLFSFDFGYSLEEKKLINITPTIGFYYQAVLKDKVSSDSYTHYSSFLGTPVSNPYYGGIITAQTSGKATQFIRIDNSFRFGPKLGLSFSTVLFSKLRLKMNYNYFFISESLVWGGKRFEHNFYQFDLGLAYRIN